jgi:hypothetical protein
MARGRKPERKIAVSDRFGQRLLQDHIHRSHQFTFSGATIDVHRQSRTPKIAFKSKLALMSFYRRNTTFAQMKIGPAGAPTYQLASPMAPQSDGLN